MWKTISAVALVACAWLGTAGAVKPPADKSPPGAFLMPVSDVFAISGRGTVALGRVERGSLKVQDAIELVGLSPTRRAVVLAIESSHQPIAECKAGDSVGLLLGGVPKGAALRGQVVAHPGSIAAYTRVTADVTFLSTADGGRHTPIGTGYRTQATIFTADVSATVALPDGVYTVPPGGKARVTLTLAAPVAVDSGSAIALREGGRVVARGVVVDLVK